MKECIDYLAPFITAIINSSISHCQVPSAFKSAVVTPLLKKSSLPQDDLSNYRPVSNLPFVSKLLEKTIARQLADHKTKHSLYGKYQSAYRVGHSTETALIRVQSDILEAMDSGKCVFLVLLDLSAAFDTVSHDVLLSRLESKNGISGKALRWISSYLTQRTQSVHAAGFCSAASSLTCGVPQGSVLGPDFFSDYISPVEDLVRSFGMSMHGYADDTQIYTSFCPGLDELSALERLEACVSFIRSWMKENKLKLNDDKTEFIILGSRRNLKKVISKNIWIGEHQIKPSACVRNIGGYFDAEMRMEVQVKETCRTAWFNLLKIRKIREYLTKDQVKTVIHAYITSRLDNNNALLFKLPKVHRSKLQIIQNCAARVIMTGVRKFDHVSPTLYELHWLPIAKRIDFKILLITYKALHGHGPLYLKELLQYKKQYWNTRSADDSSLLEIPKTRLTTYGDHAFYFSAPTLWNRLPLDVRSKPTISSFKHSLKTFLFGEAFFFN